MQPHAAALKVAHPLMLRAIAAAKKKNDRIDANKICNCLRCDFLPGCYMASTAIRERRRTLRYRNLLVRQMVQMKNKISGLLMEAGVNYNKQRLHKAGYFRELLATNPDIDEGLCSLLRVCLGFGIPHKFFRRRNPGAIERSYDSAPSEGSGLVIERKIEATHCSHKEP